MQGPIPDNTADTHTQLVQECGPHLAPHDLPTMDLTRYVCL